MISCPPSSSEATLANTTRLPVSDAVKFNMADRVHRPSLAASFALLFCHLGFLLLTPLPLCMHQQSMSHISLIIIYNPEQQVRVIEKRLTERKVPQNAKHFIQRGGLEFTVLQ